LLYLSRGAKSVQWNRLLALLAVGLSLCMANPVSAAFTITITVDENGNGQFMNSTGFSQPLPDGLFPDPGPGGAPNALTYDLLNPPGITPGDLLLLEPGSQSLSDVIRFNPTSFTGGSGSLVFYSSADDGIDTLADGALGPMPGLPSAFYANTLTEMEVGPEGNNGFTYTPTAGEPGFVAGAGGPTTYVITSDAPATATPEPATLALAGISIAGLSGYAWRLRKKPAK